MSTNKDYTFVDSQLDVRATAELAEEVEKDLEKRDPDEEQANAILRGTSKDDTKDSE